MRPFPWIRVNGTLNRRVLDRWLSVVLSTICDKPGVTLQCLQAKFSCVQPFDIRYLVEVSFSLKFVFVYLKCSINCVFFF